MKKLFSYLVLLLLPCLLLGQGFGQEVHKVINGKVCDSCKVNYVVDFEDDLSFMLIGPKHSNKLSNATKDFEATIPKSKHLHFIFVTTDSFARVVFLPGILDELFTSSANTTDHMPKLKNLVAGVLINKMEVKNWVPLSNLKPITDYQINRTIRKKDNLISAPFKETLNLGDFFLNYNDILNVIVKDSLTQKIFYEISVKRALIRPEVFFYYQTPINSKKLKDNIQYFLNESTKLDNSLLGNKNSTFQLKKGNVGVISIPLERGDEIEYTFDKQEWSQIKHHSEGAFDNKFIIIDNEDVPPGSTKKLYLRYKNKPETEYSITIQGVEDISQTSWFKIGAGFLLALGVFGSWYLYKHRQHKKQVKLLHQKNKDIETRLSLLSGQLNPHFLFNSLHAIQGTINKQNVTEANTYISNVAAFMRNVMDYGKKEFISLKEELELETDYLHLEQKRKNFEYTINIEKSIDATQIDFPPLLLQPILENSVQHAFKNNENPVLNIKVTTEQKNLLILIHDNGMGWNINEKKEGHGLGLVRKRIELINEKIKYSPVKMNIISNSENGTTTTFTFQNWLA